MDAMVRALETANDILTAGILITSAALLLYSLTYNLRDRVARTFSLILAYLTIVYLGDLAAGTSSTLSGAGNWLRLQWLGIAFIPVGHLHLADALLATTGRPSRGRRRLSIRLLYGLAAGFVLLAVFSDLLVHGPAQDFPALAPHLSPGPLFWLFVLYSAGATLTAALLVWRAYQRCLTATTRRRMSYLLIASLAPALGSFPYWLLGTSAVPPAVLFWSASILINVLVAGLITVMAYTVAFFGVNQPDRVVKSRLLQWLLRGPVVCSTVLMVVVLIGRYGRLVGLRENVAVPFFLVGTLLLLQFLITLFRIPLERLLVRGQGQEDVRRLNKLADRLLTTSDMQQFLESVLAAVCEQLRISTAFVAAVGKNDLELQATVGPDKLTALPEDLPPLALPLNSNGGAGPAEIFVWGGYWIMPLRSRPDSEVIGLLGLQARTPAPVFEPDEKELLEKLSGSIAAALEDRRLQREVFASVDRILPEIEAIQRLRAAARYSGAAVLTSARDLPPDVDLAQVVKDALTHYWGGPRLTDSPLMRFKVVEKTVRDHDGNAVNALRAVLREAIERTRPEGERRFTPDWMLYNLLEMKFLEGRKVRQVAARLALSEADLYRKQKVAIERVARAIESMERTASRPDSRADTSSQEPPAGGSG